MVKVELGAYLAVDREFLPITLIIGETCMLMRGYGEMMDIGRFGIARNHRVSASRLLSASHLRNCKLTRENYLMEATLTFYFFSSFTPKKYYVILLSNFPSPEL